MIHVLMLLALSQANTTAFQIDKGIRVRDEGAPANNILSTINVTQARGVDCYGDAISCYVDGGWWVLQVSSVSDGGGGGGGGAPTNASYITEVAESGLSNEFAMSSLGTGLVKNTTATGVPSIYAGTSCTNQFPRSLNASGVATCASVALSADVSGTLPLANGGTGSGGFTCSSGQVITSNGSAYSCTATITASDVSCAGTCVSDAEIAAMAASKLTGVVAVANGGTGSAPASDDQVLVSDSSSAATWRSVPNCTDATGNHLNYTTATNGWSCGTSQAHDVGGSSPQVQYNNAGVFGGVSATESDGTHLLFVEVQGVPAAPAAERMKFFAMQFDAGMSSRPYDIDSYFGVPTPQGIQAMFSYYSTQSNWEVMGWLPNGWGINSTVDINTTGASATAGNTSSAAWASTSLLTRSKTRRFTTNAAASANGGIKGGTTTQLVWRGNGAGAGGFKVWTRWSIAATGASSRHFTGLLNSLTFPATTVDPNTFTDAVGVLCNSADSNYSICSNDNSGTATCATLGASFPCKTNGAFYELWLEAAPNAGSIEYYVERLDSAANTAGTLTSDLPRNTVQMNPMVLINTADGGSALSVDWMGSLALSNL